MVAVTAIGGTWSFRAGCRGDGQWWGPGSAWWAALEAGGCRPLRPSDPFVWSSDIDGVRLMPFARFNPSDWHAGAHALAYYFRGVPVADRRVVAHSHGGNLVALACAEGLELEALITVSTPPRRELERAGVYAAAAGRVGRWLHVHADGSDRVQVLGAMFDGRFGIVRSLRVAGVVNQAIPRAGHSRVLNDPAWLGRWVDHGWIGFLKGA